MTAVNGLFEAQVQNEASCTSDRVILNNSQRVPKDLQTFANDFNVYASDDQGIAGSNDPGTEDTVTESFNTVGLSNPPPVSTTPISANTLAHWRHRQTNG